MVKLAVLLLVLALILCAASCAFQLAQRVELLGLTIYLDCVLIHECLRGSFRLWKLLYSVKVDARTRRLHLLLLLDQLLYRVTFLKPVHCLKLLLLREILKCCA